MKRRPQPLAKAIAVFLLGVILGAAFTFGAQFWHTPVEREDCTLVETQLLDYAAYRRLRRPLSVQKIALECADGERYFITKAHIHAGLVEAIEQLEENAAISLRIHPNSHDVVEFVCGDATLLSFDQAMRTLETQTDGFLYLGIFAYIGALTGLYDILRHGAKRRRG